MSEIKLTSELLFDMRLVSAAKDPKEDKGYYKLPGTKLRVRKNKSNFSIILNGKIQCKIIYVHEFANWCEENLDPEFYSVMGIEKPSLEEVIENAGVKPANEIEYKFEEGEGEKVFESKSLDMSEEEVEAAIKKQVADKEAALAEEIVLSDAPEKIKEAAVDLLTLRTGEQVPMPTTREEAITVIKKATAGTNLGLEFENQYAEEIEAMTWSYSRRASYDNCKLAFKKSYLEKPKPVQRENAWSQMGSFAHNLLEYMFKGTLKRENLGVNFRHHFDKKVTEKFPNFAIDLRVNYMKKIGNYLPTFKFLGEVIGIEQKFEYELPSGRKMMGFIDLVINKYGQIIVVDHKVSKTFSNKDLAIKKKQILLYAPGIKKIYGVLPSSGFFHFLQDGSKLKVNINQEDIDMAMKWMDDGIDTIKKDQYFPPILEEDPDNDLFYCSNLCGHRDNCEAFQFVSRGQTIGG